MDGLLGGPAYKEEETRFCRNAALALVPSFQNLGTASAVQNLFCKFLILGGHIFEETPAIVHVLISQNICATIAFH